MTTTPSGTGERIAKRIARAGLCSRREAERWIAAGRVSIGGEIVRSPALDVDEDADVRVDGVALAAPERARLWRYHKPKGLLATHRDPQGRPTVFDSLPAGLPRVISIGRLDLNSEGLLLLTNDGALARHLELPATGYVRRYRVRARGRASPESLAALERGVTIAGVRYGPVRAALEREQGSNVWLSVSLAEGKNREVRRVCEHLGLGVNRLIRTAYGPFDLGALPPGAGEEVPQRVVRDLLASAGLASRPKRAAHAHHRRTP